MVGVVELLQFGDDASKERLLIYTVPAGDETVLHMSDSSGRTRIMFGVIDDEPRLEFYDAAGNIVFKAP